MINKIIMGFYGFIFNFVGAFTAPISDLLTNAFPSLTNITTSINNLFLRISDYILWFWFLVPPNTKLAIIAFLTVVVACQPKLISMNILGYILDFVKRLNIFGSK